MKISISDDGSVELLENKSGVTWEQIAAHKEIKVGRQYEAKSLYEALSYLQKEACETVKVLPQESSKIKDLVEKKPEAKATLETLGLQLQQGSPAEKSVQTESPKATDVPQQPLTNITNMNTPQKLQSPDDKVIVPFGPR